MDTTVIASVLTWAEQHPALVDEHGAHLPVGLEELPAEGVDAVMLTSLTGDPYIKRYKSGGYVAAFPFAVYMRIAAGDTASRINAIKALGDMGASIDERARWPVEPEGFEYQKLVVRTLPARIRTDDTGSQDYQVTFELTYRKRG
jgi:hypothetical protein